MKRISWCCSTGTRASILSRKKKIGGGRAPAGCFPVYVGLEKQRFVLKTELANHALFKVLLEDAALLYGYKNDGPILLPCDVNIFYNVLIEIENSNKVDDVILRLGSARRLDFRTNKGSTVVVS